MKLQQHYRIIVIFIMTIIRLTVNIKIEIMTKS